MKHRRIKRDSKAETRSEQRRDSAHHCKQKFTCSFLACHRSLARITYLLPMRRSIVQSPLHQSCWEAFLLQSFVKFHWRGGCLTLFKPEQRRLKEDENKHSWAFQNKAEVFPKKKSCQLLSVQTCKNSASLQFWERFSSIALENCPLFSKLPCPCEANL